MTAPKEEIMLFLLSVYDVKAAAMQLYHIFKARFISNMSLLVYLVCSHESGINLVIYTLKKSKIFQ